MTPLNSLKSLSALDALTNLKGNTLPEVEIYTDGACSGNPGPGGWGAVICYLNLSDDLCGGDPATTNNRMEMTAAIRALEALPHSAKVTLHTDSMYLRDGVSLWMKNWKRNGWLTSDKKPVKNKDLWIQLAGLLEKHEIDWRWVKGHAGHPENERADALARSGIIKLRVNS